MANKRNVAIIFVFCVTAFCFMNCQSKTSTLTILNWPYNGQGKIAVYIDENSANQNTRPKEKKEFSDEQKERRAKAHSEINREELIAQLAEMIKDSLQKEPETKRVASYASASLSSPFKLTAKDGTGDWTGDGSYTVKIVVGLSSGIVNTIEKTDVVFSNGSATIDYNSMTVR